MIDALVFSKIALYFRTRPEEKEVIAEFLTSRSTLARGIRLTENDVQKFKRIYEHTTGKRIDIEQARDKATKLISFVHALLRISNIEGGV